MKNVRESIIRLPKERVLRLHVLTIAILVCVGSIPGLIGMVRASDGTLNPPHSDYVVDTSMPPNGLYEELIVNISVDVTVAGMFVLFVDLYDNTGGFWIDGQWLTPNLPLGVQTIQASFAGFVIRSSGYDGPYQVDIVLLDDMFMLLDAGTHMTGAYNAVDFENPPGYFTPPHSDWGLDSDGDSLFEFMIVDTNLVINASGDYSVQGTLFDNSGMWFIEWQDNISFLSPGPQTVDLAFTGYMIRSSGFDGPYRVELYLYDNFINLLHNDTYFTNPYLATDFSYPPALFNPPHNDYGLDTNGNGTFEFLVVEASVNVSVDGTYRIEGFAPFGFVQNETFLNAGFHMVELRFYGYEIFNSGMDEPYMI
ncbi:MAG: hypothetical protein KAW09_10700, partial [Thermoplasmata archaeon]|nr:hypothetical protein [Thermoplasmata archaeon]